MTKTWITIILLLFNTLILAQTPTTWPEAIVSASHVESPGRQSGRNVQVISSLEISELPVNSFDELLHYVAGVNINSRGGFGVQSDVGMRGSTFAQVLIMIDHQRFNDPLTGHFNFYLPVPLSEIDHIEIIRGPAAAAFGADAVGGVVHVFTKSYVDREIDKRYQTNGEITFGEHDLRMQDVAMNINEKGLLFSAAIRNVVSDGETYNNPNFASGVSTDTTYNSRFNLQSQTYSLGYVVNENFKLYARAGIDRRDFNAKYFYTASSFDESVEQVNQNWLHGAASWFKNNHFIEASVSYKYLEDRFVFNPAFEANQHEVTQWVGQLFHRFSYAERWQFAYGGQLVNKYIQSTDRGNHENLSFGVFGEASAKWFTNLHSHVALRVENDENFGTSVLPQASVSYTLKQFVVRAAYGQAFRAPDFTERFVSYQIDSLSPGRNAGNPDLRAEKSTSYELGADYNVSNKAQVAVTAFYRMSDNLIDFTQTNADDITNLNNLYAGADYLYATNLAYANTLGAEFTARYKHEFSTQLKGTAGLAYTWLQTETGEATLSKYVANHPTHMLNGTMDLTWRKLSLLAAATFTQRNPDVNASIDAAIPRNYTLLDMQLRFAIRSNFSLFVKVNNALDTRYQEILGAPMPGRWVAAGLKWDVRIYQLPRSPFL
ncbi:MAG: TonB-dependent receptor [Flavobacteriales bacterium]|nr:TonB-dependent receptor [Flavobacteriales bacterium]